MKEDKLLKHADPRERLLQEVRVLPCWIFSFWQREKIKRIVPLKLHPFQESDKEDKDNDTQSSIDGTYVRGAGRVRY